MELISISPGGYQGREGAWLGGVVRGYSQYFHIPPIPYPTAHHLPSPPRYLHSRGEYPGSILWVSGAVRCL